MIFAVKLSCCDGPVSCEGPSAHRGLAATRGEDCFYGGERYLSDVLIQEAGDSLMVKLGEAARRLARSDLLPPEGVSWATAVANRNFIIHQYDQIDRSITWNTLSVSLPEWNQSLRELFSAAHQIVFSTDRDA